jgi:hypothetical protein
MEVFHPSILDGNIVIVLLFLSHFLARINYKKVVVEFKDKNY